MATEVNIFYDFEHGISKVGFFLQDILLNESLSSFAEIQRKECVEYLKEMSSTLHMLKNYPTYSNTSLINAGLSQSSQNLNEDDGEFGLPDMPRSGSLPNIPSSGCEELSWSDSNTKENKPDSDFNLSDMRELVIYDPIEEEEEEEDGEDEDEEDETDLLKLSTGSRSSTKRSRKRDSAVLFDISLGDLEDFDLAGFLTEKHSGKQWYCVLMDQHLCLFPTQDPTEVAYDVVILPYCQISLDDRLMRTPVFRLTQAGMTPWVLVAKNNEELKEWINALTTAASGGKYSMTSSTGSTTNERRSSKTSCGQSMQAITEEETTEEAEEENFNLNSISSSTKTLSATVEEKELEEKDEKPEQLEVKKVEEHSVQELERLPAIPTSPDSEETFGEDLYESIGNYELEDDGFATDEFESGSSENEDASSSPKGSPRQQTKTKKRNQIFKWLKKKTRGKDRLVSSPQDGVALAGYVHRIESNTCVKRWCVVREGRIYCYKNIKDEETEVTLELEGAEIRAKEEEKNKFVIRVIRDNDRLLTLLTKNTRDMDKWKTALRIESGFIKLPSPADTSSGIFEDDEGDYVTPITPIGLQKVSKNPIKTSSESDTVNNSVANGNDEDDLYLEVVFDKNKVNDAHKITVPRPLSPFGRRSPESLGPLPPLPIDSQPPALPPPRRSPIPEVEVKKTKEESEDSEESGDIYEEVTNPLPNADKLTNWHKKEHEEKQDDDAEEKKKENKDLVSQDTPHSKVHLTSDGHMSAFKKPPLVRKVSFDDKVEVINKHLPVSMLPEADIITENDRPITADIITENYRPITDKPQAPQASEQEQSAPSSVKKPNEKEVRSLPRRALKENWIKEKNLSVEKPRNKVLSIGIKNEQDKEREIIQKAEEEFLEIAKALKEEGSAAVRQKRPSLVALNRIAFENRKREQTVDNSKFATRTQALKQEKADLLARTDFQRRRVAVAKDRKIFFTLSNTSNTAMADADMEFHESQLGLAKAKRRIAEIDNELKNIELLDFKHHKVDGVKRGPTKTEELKIVAVDGEEVIPTDQSNVENGRAKLLRGNVLSQIKAFENMGGKK